jgi:hypothetical protein
VHIAVGSLLPQRQGLRACLQLALQHLRARFAFDPSDNIIIFLAKIEETNKLFLRTHVSLPL